MKSAIFAFFISKIGFLFAQILRVAVQLSVQLFLLEIRTPKFGKFLTKRVGKSPVASIKNSSQHICASCFV